MSAVFEHQMISGAEMYEWPEFVALYDRLDMSGLGPEPMVAIDVPLDDRVIVTFSDGESEPVDEIGFAVWQWPEFQMFVARLGVDLLLPHTNLSISFPHDGSVLVSLQFHGVDSHGLHWQPVG